MGPWVGLSKRVAGLWGRPTLDTGGNVLKLAEVLPKVSSRETVSVTLLSPFIVSNVESMSHLISIEFNIEIGIYLSQIGNAQPAVRAVSINHFSSTIFSN